MNPLRWNLEATLRTGRRLVARSTRQERAPRSMVSLRSWLGSAGALEPSGCVSKGPWGLTARPGGRKAQMEWSGKNSSPGKAAWGCWLSPSRPGDSFQCLVAPSTACPSAIHPGQQMGEESADQTGWPSSTSSLPESKDREDAQMFFKRAGVGPGGQALPLTLRLA